MSAEEDPDGLFEDVVGAWRSLMNASWTLMHVDPELDERARVERGRRCA
jgi:hypothetical protein